MCAGISREDGSGYISINDRERFCLVHSTGRQSCTSYTMCLAQSRNRETQRRNYPREGRLEGVEGEKGEGRLEGEEDISWTSSLLDVFPALPPTTPFILQNPPLQICRPLIRPNMQWGTPEKRRLWFMILAYNDENKEWQMCDDFVKLYFKNSWKVLSVQKKVDDIVWNHEMMIILVKLDQCRRVDDIVAQV